MRSRKEFDSLEEENEEFRPRNIQPWSETPEEFYSREELRRLAEKEVMKLPAKYRVALMLRDLEELSTEEAAALAQSQTSRLEFFDPIPSGVRRC